MRKAEETNCGRSRESVGEKGHRLPRLYIKLFTPVPSVADTATKKSDFWVTADAVQSTDVIYDGTPLSLEVDRCQLFFWNMDRMRKSVVNLFMKTACYIIKDKTILTSISH